ncbi:unnamed protein product, partial [Closterium sp. NIES-54]
ALENTTNLYGSLPMEVSTLTALTYLNLQGNLLRYRIDSFTTYLRFLPLADIRLHYNYLYGEIPSFLMNLPKLTQFGAVYNYLIGTVPALASQLRSLDVRGNFLTDVPAINYTFCGCAGNCMVTPSKCISGGTIQRPAAQCAICGTTNGVGPFCWGAGGECVADVMALWDVGAVNSPTRPVQPSVCIGGSVQAMVNSAAMLAIKSSLGVTLNSWAASVPCSVWAVSPSVPTWSNVICDGEGNVVRINMSNTGLTGSIPADISKLEYLTYLSLSKQLFQAPLSAFTANLLGATMLNELQLQYNWLYGSVPTSLFTLKLLSVLDLSYNYLTGSFPATTSLASLDIRSNFFYAVGSMTLQSCAALSNCLATPASCSSAGTTQRPTADCAICGSTNGQPPFCGGTGTCSPDSGPAAAQGTPNLAGSPLLPMVCSGIAIDAADATVLLALKSSLGVTLNNWNAAALCTLEGQTLLPAQWGGVRCTGAGKVTSIGLFSNYLTGTVPIPSKSLLALDVGFNFLSGVFPTLPLMFCAGENNCFVNSTNCRTYGSVQRPAGACAICGTAAGQGDLCFGGSCAPSSTAAISAGTVNSPNQPILPMACSGQCVPHTAGCVSHPFPLSDILPFRTGLNIHITLPIAPPPAPASLTLLMPPAMPHLTLSLSPLLPNSPVADNSAAPMDTGSALGVTFTSWLAASPCAIANSSITVAGTWTGVLCSSAGDVLSINLSSSALGGTIHADISKLTALTYLSVPSPTCQCPHLPVSALTYLSVPSTPLARCFFQRLQRVVSYPKPPSPTFLSACLPLTCATSKGPSMPQLCLLLVSIAHPLPDLSKNVLRASLASFVSSFSSLQALQQLRLNNNWFAGSLPQTLMSLPALTLLDVHANALTGSLPAISSVLRSLLLHDNFLAGSFTAAALTACDASLNCMTSAADCSATSTTQRAAAACAICDSAAAQGLLCWGGTCLPNVTSTTAHPDGLAPAPMYCSGSPVVTISNVDAVALAALKAAIGVSFTTWAPATFCTVAPTTPITGTWDGVLCNSAGRVVSLLLPNSKLTGTLPLVVSTLTALTAIDLTSNLLLGRLDEVATQLRLLTNLKSIDLSYNWLSGSVPAFMFTLPSLTKITMGYNYLTGALPPVTSPLSVVDVQFNFLAGTFPTLTLSLCAARMNCFLDATKCKNPNRASELPRATTACAICNTTNAQGRLCNGGLCTVNATDLVPLGAPNSALSPSLPFICVGAAFVAMDAGHAGVMLNLKASLGVTFTDWKADSPCSMTNVVAAGSWSGVTCDDTGKVLGIVLSSQKLAGSIHSDISKLATLTSLDLQSNLLQGRLDSFTASIKTPLVLKEL